MASHLIVAEFDEYGAAHRAFCELIKDGVRPNDISIVAGDRSNSRGAARDFGLLEEDAETYLPAVRRGRTVLAVRAADRARSHVADIVGQYRPAEIEELGPAATTGGPPRA